VDEAQAKLDQFRRVFLPHFVGPATVVGKTPENRLQELLDPGQFAGALVQDLYVAEAFLSLDAAPDAEAFFLTELVQAETDAARLSRAIVLGQILLLERRHRDFAELTTETIAPLLTRSLVRLPADEAGDNLDPTSLVGAVGELAVLPMGAADFLSQWRDLDVQEMGTRWRTLQANANGSSRPLFDLVVRGIERSLMTRAMNRPAGRSEPTVDDEAGRRITALRTQMRVLARQR
jgi:hypothetical protein